MHSGEKSYMLLLLLLLFVVAAAAGELCERGMWKGSCLPEQPEDGVQAVLQTKQPGRVLPTARVSRT